MSTLATLAIALEGNIGGFLSSMGAAEKAAGSAGSSIASKLGQGLATVGKLAAGIAAAGIVAAGTAMLGSMNVTMDWASKLDDLGDVLGTTANEGAAVLVALKPFGSAGEEITGQMAKLAAGLEDGKGGLGESGKLMKKLGIEFRDAHGKMLPATKLMENIGNKVSAMPDGLQKTALMMDLFGKSGKGMSDAMSALSTGGMEEARKKAEAFGLTIGEDGLANTLEMQKGMADLELAGQGLAVTFGGPLLKAILPIVEGMAKWAVQVMPKLREGLDKVTKPLGDFITMVGNLLGGLASGADPLGLVTNAVFQFLQILGMDSGAAGNLAIDIGKLIGAITKGDWSAVGKMASEWAGKLLNWVQNDVIPFIGGKISELATKIGELITTNGPVIVEKVKEWGAAFLNWVGTDVLPNIGAKVTEIAGKIRTWIETEGPIIATKLGEWGTAFLGWVQTDVLPNIGAKVTEIAGKIRTWIETEGPIIATKLGEWGTAFLGWVQTDVTPTLGEKLGAIWTTMSTWIGEQTTNIGKEVGKWAAAFGDWIVNDFLPSFPSKLEQIYTAISTWVSETVVKLQTDQLKIANTFWEWIQKDAIPWLNKEGPKIALALIAIIVGIPLLIAAALVTVALAVVNGIIGGIQTFFEEKGAELAKLGKQMMDGLVKGITDAASSVWEALKKILNDAVGQVKAFFGIKSPSKLMAGIGFNISAGMAAGIMKGSGLVTKAMGSLGAGVMGSGGAGVIGSVGAGVMGSVGAGNGTPVIQVFIGEEQLEPILAKMIYRSQRRAYA